MPSESYPLPPDLAIRALGLSKRYTIGLRARAHDTLREQLTAGVRTFLRGRFRRATATAHLALQKVSFDVPRGQVVGIIGGNGAGKSTLLKILARVTAPTEGTVHVRGRVGALLEVGSGFHPELTGRENVFLNGAMLGMRKAEVVRKFDQIVEFAEIDQFIDTPVKRYSSGMFVRLAFAVAAHLEPDILIVDEALAVGDFAFQRKCLGQLHTQAGSGRTVLFVSHNLGAIRTLCNRCLLLESGELILDGPADSVVERYIEHCSRTTTATQSGPQPDDEGEGFLLHWLDPIGGLTIFCGDPLRLDFEVEAAVSLDERQAGFRVTLTSSDGNPLVTMSSAVQAIERSPATSRRWRVKCDMGRLPLNAGTYYATVHVGDGRKSTALFSRAVHIRILEHDVFGSGGYLPKAKYWGPFYWAPRWNIQPLDEQVLPQSDGEPVAIASAMHRSEMP